MPDEIKGCISLFIVLNIGSTVIKRSFPTECHNATGKSVCNIREVFDVAVDHQGSVFRQEFCEKAERVADVIQILEEIQMIGIDIQDHADLWEEMQEAVRILAGFCDEKSGASHTDVAVNRLEDSAHGNRGVHVSGEKNV